MSQDSAKEPERSGARETRPDGSERARAISLASKIDAGATLGGRYVVVEELGSGGYGSVHRARDLQLDREVALKLLHGFARSVSSDEMDAVLKEGRALARLQHPNIVPVFDAGRIEDLPFLTMGLVRGRPLDSILRTEGALPLPRAVRLLEQLCAALDHAHRAGLVHRDVKPVNLLVDEEDTLQLVDFGIALGHRGSENDPGLVSGTVGYIAPEVMRGEPADAKSDQFAAALTFQEMLSARRVFDSKTPTAYVSEVQNAPATSRERLPEGLPRALRAALERALSIDPAARFPTCQDFARALRDVVDAPARRRRRAGLATGLVLVAAAAALFWPRRPLQVDSNLRGLVEARDGSHVEISVDDRASLTAGDWFWLDGVRVTRPAHVYALLLDSSGEVALLCPGPACDTTEPLQPGLPHRLPGEGEPNWQLDQAAGFESVFLLASVEPVPDAELRSIVAEARARVRSADGGMTRGVRLAPLPDTLEERVVRERELVELLGRRFDHVRSHRVVHD